MKYTFRDETRKRKWLLKSSTKVAFPAIPPQREQDLADTGQAAPQLPAARVAERQPACQLDQKCHCHCISIPGCQMKKQG